MSAHEAKPRFGRVQTPILYFPRFSSPCALFDLANLATSVGRGRGGRGRVSVADVASVRLVQGVREVWAHDAWQPGICDDAVIAMVSCETITLHGTTVIPV